MGTYNTGVLLGLRWTYIEEKNGEWIESQQQQSDSNLKVMLLGELPFEAIETVNFEGDDYYSQPHIFCHFDFKGEPYKRLFYGQEQQLDPNFPTFYSEVSEYKPTRRKWLRRTK